MDGRKLAAWIAIAVLGIGAAVLGLRVMQLVPQVREEMTATPTPDPVIGNVLLVTPDPNAPTAPPLLKRGYEGEAITQLQTRLAELGYYPGLIDGQYGAGTQAAVTLFQQVNGLDADGVAGPATLTLVYSDGALRYEPTPSPVPTAVPTETPAPTEEPTAVPAAAMRKPYVRDDGLPLLVNRSHLLPEGYEPLELVNMTEYCDKQIVKIKYNDVTAEREAVDALMVMLRAAVDEGITPWQVSAAYRDEAYQKRLFDKQVKEYMNKNGMSRSRAIQATRKTVADPGTSEHHLGTSFDITVPGTTFAGTKQAKWLAEHCWDYGFILRYTKEKQDVTGFLAEAWHYRYVGVEHSLIMRDRDLCLEEYIEQYGVEVEEWLD